MRQAFIALADRFALGEDAKDKATVFTRWLLSCLLQLSGRAEETGLLIRRKDGLRINPLLSHLGALTRQV